MRMRSRRGICARAQECSFKGILYFLMFLILTLMAILVETNFWRNFVLVTDFDSINFVWSSLFVFRIILTFTFLSLFLCYCCLCPLLNFAFCFFVSLLYSLYCVYPLGLNTWTLTLTLTLLAVNVNRWRTREQHPNGDINWLWPVFGDLTLACLH